MRLRYLIAFGIQAALVGVVLARWPRRAVRCEYEDEHLTEWAA
jgi:hypothetical protein